MKKILEWEDKVLSKYLQKHGLSSITPEQIRHINDWLSSDEGQAYHSRILRISVPQAINLSKKWTESLLKKNVKEEAGDSHKVLECKNGFYWVEVLTKNGLIREGSLMRHCVASYSPKVERKYSRIFSLRDEKNHPHATVEIKPLVERYGLGVGRDKPIYHRRNKGHRFSQINGKANVVLAEKYVPYLKDFLNFAIKEYQLQFKDFLFFRNYNLIKYKNEIVESNTLSHFKGNLYIHEGVFLADEVTVEGKVNVCSQCLIPQKLTVLGDLYLREGVLNPEAEVKVSGTIHYNPQKFEIPAHWQIASKKEQDSNPVIFFEYILDYASWRWEESRLDREGQEPGGARLRFYEDIRVESFHHPIIQIDDTASLEDSTRIVYSVIKNRNPVKKIEESLAIVPGFEERVVFYSNLESLYPTLPKTDTEPFIIFDSLASIIKRSENSCKKLEINLEKNYLLEKPFERKNHLRGF